MYPEYYVNVKLVILLCPISTHKEVKHLFMKYFEMGNYCSIIKALIVLNLSKSNNNFLLTFDSFAIFMKKDVASLIPEISNFSNREISILRGGDADAQTLNYLYKDLLSIDRSLIDQDIFSTVYELSLSKQDKKKNGIYYTPYEVIKSISDKTLENISVIDNPFVKILDPACGSGNFLNYMFDKLYELYKKDLDKINKKFEVKWDNDSIKKHIVENNLFGADIDINAVIITKLRLLMKAKGSNICYTNIIMCDTLIKYEKDYLGINQCNYIFWSQEFDFIIGNPPYMNMQKSNAAMKEYVSAHYKGIYSGQNDMYYYFMYRSIEKLKTGGVLGFIIPVYFIEATYALKLRRFLEDNLNIIYFKDLSYFKIFDNTEIHCCIFIGIKYDKTRCLPKSIYTDNNKMLLYEKDNWIFVDRNIYGIIEKLNSLSKLRDYAFICKGMDTGLNECFLINKDVISQYCIERELIRPVVRSCDIKKYFVNQPCSNFLLYTVNETDIYKFPNAYKYLSRYADKLKLRWGFKNGFCSWFSLSTLRNRTFFESRNSRIFVSYRCRSNKFAIDKLNSIGLTDTTAIFPQNSINEYYLLAILNSKLINFYNSICGKRKGLIFEYFPVPISKFPIKTTYNSLYYDVIDNVLKIVGLEGSKDGNLSRIIYLENLINQDIYQIYGILDEEIKIIEKYYQDKDNNVMYTKKSCTFSTEL